MAKLEEVILRDITGNRPAAGIAGRLFFDETLVKWQRDTGVAWEDCEPLVEHAVVLGYAGTLPAAAAADTADFAVPVPFNMTFKRIIAQTKTDVGADTTMQVRKSVDDGDSFANFFGTVQILDAAKQGTADPADADADEGDVLQFSITIGGASGTNLIVMLVGVAR